MEKLLLIIILGLIGFIAFQKISSSKKKPRRAEEYQRTNF